MANSNDISCPISLPIPFTVTVNTSGDIPTPIVGHADATTHTGFTRISEFTFIPSLSVIGDPNTSLQLSLPADISLTTAIWDFGDGYTLSGDDVFIPTHTYNVPGLYTVSVFFYDRNGDAFLNTLTQQLSVYNYANTRISVRSRDLDTDEPISIFSGRKPVQGDRSLGIGLTASWQDVPDPNEPHTVYFTASGSKAKPYDINNKYAHLIPYNAFYDKNLNLINSIYVVQYQLNPQYFVIDTDTAKITPITAEDQPGTLLYSSTKNALTNSYNLDLPTYRSRIHTARDTGEKFYYYDDIPNYIDSDRVNLLIRLDTSKHKLKDFYVDNLTTDINNSERTYSETNFAGASSANTEAIAGIPIKVLPSTATRLSFTSTGMKEMSAIQHKRQGDKFQIFIALSDNYNNILKSYPIFNFTDTQNTYSSDHTFYVNWVSGDTTTTSNISSISTNKFPYNTTTEKTELSSFLYTNITPPNSGSWTLNITGRVDSLSSQQAVSFYSDDGCLGEGCVGSGNVGTGIDSINSITGSYTFTISPSTNDVEIYKINEDCDYSQVLKSYRFQSFLHEYDKLFDGVFTSFVGEASSSPTAFGKTIFEKTANFVSNNSDVDFCKIENIQAFYDFFNEEIDFVTPTPPPGLKRLYDLFSIKICRLLGDYERVNDNFSTQYYTNSAASRNVNLNSPITTLTYELTAGTNIVALQKFNDEYILIKPQKVAIKSVDGPVEGEDGTYSEYPLSAYNEYSNWGWPLDTSVSGASGLDLFYEFYPYTTYDTTASAENIKNSIIDYNNPYTTISRSISSLSGDWEKDDGGIIFKNLDYQIRKGLNL